MFVEVLLDVVLIGVGDGDVFVAKDDAEAVYLFDLVNHRDWYLFHGAKHLVTHHLNFICFQRLPSAGEAFTVGV